MVILMLSITDINFANGAFGGGGGAPRINGMEVMIMQSSENADKVIADFEEAIAKGYDPNKVIDQILTNRGLKESDFTDSDIKRINRRVEAIYRLIKNGKGYKGF